MGLGLGYRLGLVEKKIGFGLWVSGLELIVSGSGFWVRVKAKF